MFHSAAQVLLKARQARETFGHLYREMMAVRARLTATCDDLHLTEGMLQESLEIPAKEPSQPESAPLSRRQTQEMRIELLRRLAAAQEDERRRISRELHDEMGQALTGLILGLKSLGDTIPQNEETRARLCQLSELAGQIGRQIHNLAAELRPPALDELGLVEALSSYLEVWAERTGIQVDFENAGLGEERLPAALETALYRTVQEALTNVARHAGAKNVSVVLERREGKVRTIIEDDGRGFNADAFVNTPKAHRHLGLLGMQERLASVGGSLQVESTPGSGTSVFAEAPLSPSLMEPHPSRMIRKNSARGT